MNQTIVEAAKALPPAERLELLDEIWESLSADKFEPELTTAQVEELDRRLADCRSNPDDAHSWEDVKTALTAKFPRKQ